MRVLRIYFLLGLVSLEVGGSPAAMEAGGDPLQINKLSSSIKPCYPSVILSLLLPGSGCGKVPDPFRSSKGGGAGSCRRLGDGVWHLPSYLEPLPSRLEAQRRSVRLADRRLRRRRGRRRRGLPRGAGARPVLGEPVQLGVLPAPARYAGVHGEDVQHSGGGRRWRLRRAIDVRRRPRLASELQGSHRASNICLGWPKAGKATRAADSAITTPKPILPDIDDGLCGRKKDKTMAEIQMEVLDESSSFCFSARQRHQRSAAPWGPCPVLQGPPRRRAHPRGGRPWLGRCYWAPPTLLRSPPMLRVYHARGFASPLCFNLIRVGPPIASWRLPWYYGVHAVCLRVLPGLNRATRVLSDRVVWLLGQIQYSCCVLSILQPQVLAFRAPIRQLLLWRQFDDSASTWVLIWSFLYRRRRHQHHLSVAAMFLLRRLHRPNLNRRYARSVHPGARVFDAPANTPHQQNRPHLRFSQRCCLLYWSQDLNVTASSPEDLFVFWLF